MSKTNSSLVLLLTSLIWGFAFVSQRQAGAHVGPLGYNGIRMLLGFLVLIPFLIRYYRKSTNKERIEIIKNGFIAGILLLSASFFQQKGIESTSAGKAGFITSLYILFVPVITLIMGKRISKKTWLCVLSGLFGAFLLSLNGREGIKKGDALVFISAILFSLHVIYIDKVGSRHDGAALSSLQFLFAGTIAFLLSLIFENNSLEAYTSITIPLLYGGIGSCGIAYTLQIIGQKNTDATRATLILSLESVFSALGGALILHESMSTKEIIGASILFISVLIAQIDTVSTHS